MHENGLFGLDAIRAWDTELAFAQLSACGQADTKRTAERRMHALNLLPPELRATDLRDELGRPPRQLVLDWDLARARRKRQLVLFAQLYDLPGCRPCLHANDARGARYWHPLAGADSTGLRAALIALQQSLDKEIVLFPHGALASALRTMDELPSLRVALLPFMNVSHCPNGPGQALPPHLQRLEAEAIHILREAVAESDKPVMLYSIGKDSSVMLHLARKAFFPAPPPFPLLHIDTRWKFQEMYLFRDQIAQSCGMDLLVHINPEAIAKDINPFDHGSALHTDITKTEGLKQALDHYGFDLAFGGARRDEEKSRAKERIFSFRNALHQWDPKRQRPELWNLYNTRKQKGESLRVFPLSNWTELDIWQYIHCEAIPVVPLYFTAERPVVERDGMLLMVDDNRFQLLPGEEIQARRVRFRTLGCYPLTGAIESEAQDTGGILADLIGARQSERQGRAIDSDTSGSMEKKKREGYF